MCAPPSPHPTSTCTIAKLTSLQLGYSEGTEDGIRMDVPHMTRGNFGTLLLPTLLLP